MRSTFFGPKKADFFNSGEADCEKIARTISKIPKDSERARASPKKLFFILVSEFGKWLFRNILEIVSKLRNLDFFIFFQILTTRLREDYSYDFKNSKRSWKSSGFSRYTFFYFGLRVREVVVSQHFRSGCFKDFEFYISYRRISLQPL